MDEMKSEGFTEKTIVFKIQKILEMVNAHPDAGNKESLTMQIVDEFLTLMTEYQHMLNFISSHRDAAIKAGHELETVVKMLRTSLAAKEQGVEEKKLILPEDVQ